MSITNNQLFSIETWQRVNWLNRYGNKSWKEMKEPLKQSDSLPVMIAILLLIDIFSALAILTKETIYSQVISISLGIFFIFLPSIVTAYFKAITVVLCFGSMVIIPFAVLCMLLNY